jgi:hypothetical protein
MGTNIVFIDSRVTDYQTLIDCLTDPAEVSRFQGSVGWFDANEHPAARQKRH